MAFVSAMNSPDITKVGVNSANVYTEDGVGDYRVSLFTMLNRGLDSSYISEYVDKIIIKGDDDEICDLFVMAFQTRDIRGGKGEKDLFYKIIMALYQKKPDIIKKMIKLIPEYGCWRDMWVLIREIVELEDSILSYTKEVLNDDISKLEKQEITSLSLLGKWAPREGSGTYPGIARKIANYIYSDIQSARQRIVIYRKEIAKLNKSLKTVEVDMCRDTWRDIKPEGVPGRCMKLHKKAFLNQPIKSRTNTFYRYPDSKDRMECREHFLEFIDNVKKGISKVHGSDVVMPHELVKQIMNGDMSGDEKEINQGQWNDIRKKTKEAGGLGKSVPMCDFSGSMNGLPMLISLALGILISEINHPSFKNHILTFDESPVWHSFIKCGTLYEKVMSVTKNGRLGQGLNTNFYKACMKILEKMVDHKVPVGEEPDNLIVLTDMGWDAAHKPSNIYTSKHIKGKEEKWSTQVEQIRLAFKTAGEKLWGEGKGWKMPTIVIWNLQACYKDFHASAMDDGVIMLSGWSPSILKVLQNSGVQTTTPYEAMRSILDDERYEPVRKLFRESISNS